MPGPSNATTRRIAHLFACFGLAAAIPAAAQTPVETVLPTAGSSTGDNFGAVVAVAGSVAVAGAPFEDPPFSNAGAAYVYTNDGTNWTGPTRIDAESGFGNGDNFGAAVATDGSWVVVGSPNSGESGVYSAGAVFLYEENLTGGWDLVDTLFALDAATGDDFGAAVTIEGNRILVGAPLEGGTGSVYLFTFDGTNWDTGTKIAGAGLSVGASFGTSVALKGAVALVGAPLQSGGGVVRVLDGTSAWATAATLNPSNDNADDQFGFSIGFDGTNAIVSAHLHDFTVGGNGDNRGTAYIYDAANWLNPPAQINTIGETAVGDNFAHSVSLVNGIAIVGVPRQGSTTLSGVAYVYENGTSGWTRTHTLEATGAAIGGKFGWGVAGGPTAIVGAPGNSQQTAHIFEIATTPPIDSDGDGLYDSTEITIGTDPNNPDTDGDGLSDGDEVNTYNTNPNDPDTDGDGFTDLNDPFPLDPDAPGYWIQQSIELADSIDDISLAAFNGPNNNANKGRRNALANRVRSAAKALQDGDYSLAIDKLESALAKVDGIEPEPDWMEADSPEREALASEITVLIGLLMYG